jgi:ribosome modulation factor
MKAQKGTKEYAYQMGYDCGINGANTTNCSFAIFSDHAFTKEWERGKRNAEKIK